MVFGKSRKTEIPLVPFLLEGYIGAVLVMTRLVKRETGVIPVRSRHCDKGVQILFPHGKPLVHGTGKAESV